MKLENNIPLTELMELTTETLAQKQIEALIDRTAAVLDSVAKGLREGEYENILGKMEQLSAREPRDDPYLDFAWAPGQKGLSLYRLLKVAQSLEDKF